MFRENKFDINNSCKIYKVGDEVKIEYIKRDNNSSGDLNSSDIENNIKIGEIRYKKNKYYFMPNILEKIDNLSDDCNDNFTWLIFKGDKYPTSKNKYKIKEGDIFRLGGICFIIRGIHVKKKMSEESNTNCLISFHSQAHKGIKFDEYRNDSFNSGSDDLEDENDFSEEENKVKKYKGFKSKEKNIYSSKKIKIYKKDKFENKNEKIFNIKQNSVHKNINCKPEKQKICRICYLNESDSNYNALIKPCKCSGSMKYIHYKCLLHWLKTKVKLEKQEYIYNQYFSMYSSENIQCELCKETFPHIVKHNNKLFNLTEYEQNYDIDSKRNDNEVNKNEENFDDSLDDYIVLDRISSEKSSSFRYIVKFCKNIIKVGRGLDMNLILDDLSISRNQCQLEINEKGDVYLQDNNSKFGTLVLVQAKSIEILKGQNLTIQVGRTFFDVSYKKNTSFFCCEAEEIDRRTTYEKINYKSFNKGKHCVILTESDSEEEECDKYDLDLNEFDKNKKQNSLKMDNNIIDNKKISVKIIKRNFNILEQEETNFKSKKDLNHVDENINKLNINSKKEKNKTKKRLSISKSVSNKENGKFMQ